MANTFKNQVLKAVGTTPTTVYTAPAGTQSTIIGMTISNVDVSPISVSVGLGTGGTLAWLVKDATISPGGALVPIGGDQKVVLEATDNLQVNTSVSSSADVVVSVLEVTT